MPTDERKYTRGPWHVEVLPTGRRLVAELVEGRPGLCHYRIVHDGEDEGQGRADADLIAAAPEMYEALRHAVEWLDEQGCDCGTDEPGTCALCEARAAIAKARGCEG